MYEKGIEVCRRDHIPVLFHVTELTQPLGHSTSGSHERYKTAERLEWEKEYDCIKQMRKWIISESIASDEELKLIESESVENVKKAKKAAWIHYQKPLLQLRDEFLRIADVTTCNCAKTAKINSIKEDLRHVAEPIRKDIMSAAKKILRLICDSGSNPSNSLKINVSNWLEKELKVSHEKFNTFLYSEYEESALKVKPVDPAYADDALLVPGREILRDNWDFQFEKNQKLVLFGEDVGKIGGVNQTYEGLQSK